MAVQLLRPPRGVAYHDQRLVVDPRILVGLLVPQHRPDRLQQLVCGRDHGSFVTASYGQLFAEVVKLTILGTRRGVGALVEDRTEVTIATTGTDGVTLASTLVIARTHPRPCREALDVGKLRQVRTDLDE